MIVRYRFSNAPAYPRSSINLFNPSAQCNPCNPCNFLILLLLSALTSSASPPLPSVPTEQHVVTNVYHGVSVIDPYQWLEDATNPAVRDWMRQQNERTRA